MLSSKIGYGIIALSTALVGVMIWASRRGASRGFRGYADVKDIEPNRIAELEGSYNPSPRARPVKRSKNSCSPVKLAGNLSSNTQVIACHGKEPRTQVKCARDIYDFLKGQQNLLQEEFVVLSLNNQNEVLASTVVGRGTVGEALVSPLDTFRTPIILGAPRIAIAHNHPSGNPTPGKADQALTKRLFQAGELVGVAVLDHVIIGHDDYASLRDLGMMSF